MFKEVPNERLSKMRGRFFAPSAIVEFGVQMVSQWQTSQGEILTAAATLRINLNSGNSEPTVTFAPHLTIVEPGSDWPSSQAAAPSFANGGEGTERVAGVAQVIQVAGDGNSIHNRAAVTITGQAPTHTLPAGDSGPVEETATSSLGSVVRASLGAGEMAVAIQSAGGVVSQKVRGTDSDGIRTASGIVQRAQVAGDLHRIQNLLNVVMYTTPQSTIAMPASGMREALSRLHGLRPAGLF